MEGGKETRLTQLDSDRRDTAIGRDRLLSARDNREANRDQRGTLQKE